MKLLITLPLATLLSFCLFLPSAEAQKDVPAGNWAAKSVKSVTEKKIMETDASGKFNGNKPVTRYELAVTLDRFIHYIEAGKKPLNPPPPGKGAVLPKNAPADVKQALDFLTRNAFIPANSPLVTKNGIQPVSAKELADTMAQVTIRLSDRGLPPPVDQ